jgi:hypothetical protein
MQKTLDLSTYQYSPFAEEEFPMTMQVAMVGMDGIVLASDTKWQSTLTRGNLRSRHTSGSSKIAISDELSVAIACAQNMETAYAIADAVIAELSGSDWDFPINPMEQIGQRFLDASGERNSFQCLVVTARPSLRLFQLESACVNGVPNKAMCHEIKNKAINGDNANAAVFWAERYYKMKSVQALMRLAAQLIVDSAKLNSGFIGGLEIVICDGGGIRRLPDDLTTALELEAEKRGKAIEELFFGRP